MKIKVNKKITKQHISVKLILSTSIHVRTKRKKKKNADSDSQRTMRTEQDHIIDLQNRGIQVIAFKEYR